MQETISSDVRQSDIERLTSTKTELRRELGLFDGIRLRFRWGLGFWLRLFCGVGLCFHRWLDFRLQLCFSLWLGFDGGLYHLRLGDGLTCGLAQFLDWH